VTAVRASGGVRELPRLELVDITQEEVPKPRGAIAYEAVKWVQLRRGDSTVTLVSTKLVDRVGVSAAHAGRHVSYRECTKAEAREAVRKFLAAGFKLEST
jgi:hypothetical protein